jgi:hypothetical protein
MFFIIIILLFISNINSKLNDDEKVFDHDFVVENDTRNLNEFFNTAQYRLNINTSSACNYTGNDRQLKCHLINIFDWEAYNKTLTNLRQMFILRLRSSKFHSIDHTNSTLNNRVKFLSKMFDDENVVKHTKFDKENLLSRTVQSMHIVQETGYCTEILKKPTRNALCLKFPMKLKAMFNSQDRFYSSIHLWLSIGIRRSGQVVNTTQKIRITNQNYEKSVYIDVKNGWNSIDITSLIDNQNVSLFETLIVKCYKDCPLEIYLNGSFSNKPSKLPVVALSVYGKLKPLVQVNNPDDKLKPIQRVRRSSSRHSQSKNDIVLTNLCKNNKVDPRSKCCLMSLKLDFSVLKLTQWVISPLSYNANYCFGTCGSTNGKIFFFYINFFVFIKIKYFGNSC